MFAMPYNQQNKSDITLDLLCAVEEGEEKTQRQLALELGIALGLVNTYLKRCVRKGWVKITHVPMRRYSYYVTPQGFAEKARLTVEYLDISFSFFRQAREDVNKLLARSKSSGWSRFIFIGSGDLAEVAILSAMGCGVKVVAVFDPAATNDQCAGLPIVKSLEALEDIAGEDSVDAVLLTATDCPTESLTSAYDVARHFGYEGHDRVLVPEFLRLPPVAENASGDGS